MGKLLEDLADVVAMMNQTTGLEQNHGMQVAWASEDFVGTHHATITSLTDRLEAADALLLDIKEWDVAEASRRFSLSDNGVIFILPDVLRSRIQSHLQGAGDEA